MNSLEEEVDGLCFIDKLVTIYEKGELDFWEERENPPNLSKDEFDQVLYRLDESTRPSSVKRISEDGPHGKTGEKFCFKFNCSIEFGGIFEIEIKRYFIKGYFFDDGDLKGFTIQSFRLDD